LKIFIDTSSGRPGGIGYVDYTQSIADGSLSIADSINVPTTINFTLLASGDSFDVPPISSYIKIVSEIYAASGGYLQHGQAPLTAGKVLATGFLTNEPERQFLGLNKNLSKYGFQQLAYLCNATSDEWLLNTRIVPFVPAFVNQTQGQILASLAEALAPPGFFNVSSFVASGDIVPYFQYDPQLTWADIAKTFADASRYRYQVIDRTIYFQPFGDRPLGVEYDETAGEKKFFPLDMQTSVLTTPPVNDALVLGADEPQGKWDNYFVGDGFTSNFKLRNKMFRGSSSLLLQDDWTENSFENNLWTVRDPFGVFDLPGALNVIQLGASGTLNETYIVGNNGLELGGRVDVQTGEFQFVDVCEGIVGGIYVNATLTQENCIAGFRLTTPGIPITVSGFAAGVVIQPLLNGQLVGPQVVSQLNHHYQLEIWFGGQNWNRYEAAYRTLTGSAQYGGLTLESTADITYVIRDLDLAAINAAQYNLFIQTGGVGPPQSIIPVETKYTVSQTPIPSFGIYAPINSENLNLTLNFTLIQQPPQGSLEVKALTGASGGLLPVATANLGEFIQYTMGFGLANPTATITQTGDSTFLSFFDDTIPGVGSRIRFVEWANGQSMSRVQNSVAIAQEAVISGDSGARSAIITSMEPKPRTSDECELAAAAAILDRSYPQFQGTYLVYTIPWRFEDALNPSQTDYPRSGRYLYVNAPMRAITGQNFFASSIKTQIVELREEILQVQVTYGPDLYLEKLLTKFIQRPEPNILGPTEQTVPPLPIQLEEAGSFYVPMFASGQVTSVINSLDGNFITIDLHQLPVTAAEVRRVDSGWGQNDQNLIGLFTAQTFLLPRTARDQTYYIRPRNGNQTSRFSYIARVNMPLIPSPPLLSAVTNSGFVLNYNGDVRDIYGVEIRIPAITGSTGVVLPISHTLPPNTNSNLITKLVRSALTRPDLGGQLYNVLATYNTEFVDLNVGDVILVTCPADASFNGLKVVSYVLANVVGWFDLGQPFPDQIGDNSGLVAGSQLYSTGLAAQLSSASISGGMANLTTTFPHGMSVGDQVVVGANWASSIQSPPVPYNQSQDSGPWTGVWIVTEVPDTVTLRFPTSSLDVVDTTVVGLVAKIPSNSIPANPTSDQLATTNTTTLFRRPVFAPSDLSFDLTDSRVQQVLALVTSFAQGGGIPFYAYFFNLTWDYSLPLNLIDVVSITASGGNSLGIANLAVDDSTKIASWTLTGSKPDGYRVTVSDQVTMQVYDQFTLDNPSNPQPLTQFTLTDADFYAPRNINVTPFNSLGDGTGQTIGHVFSGTSSGGNNTGTYTIGCTFNGLVPSQYILVRVPFDLPVTFYQNMVPSQAWIDIPPSTADMVLSIQKISVASQGTVAPPYIVATEFGTLTYSPGSSKGVFCSTLASFNPGDVLKVIAPIGTSDGVGIGFTLSGTKVFGTVDANGNVVPPAQPGDIQLLLSDDLNAWDDFIPSYTIDLSIIGLSIDGAMTMTDAFSKDMMTPQAGFGDGMTMGDGVVVVMS